MLFNSVRFVGKHNYFLAKNMSSFNFTEPQKERNVEIKARINSEEDYQKKVKIAEQLTLTKGELIPQRDVFFKSQLGRLKLRYLQNTKSMLVYYDRPDIAGPKLSEFDKIETDDPAKLERILTASNGVLGIVQKQRLLFIYENTRIHLDKVDDLGNYLEFEVCLKPDQTVEDGQLNAEKLMKLFDIKEADLITGAYFDLLSKG